MRIELIVAATIRVFWKCPRKGCKTFKVTDLEAPGGKPVVRGAADVWDIHAPLFGAARVRADWEAAGLVCEAHSELLAGSWQQAKFNPEKACDGRCTHARRASCECSCGGENHGRSHL